MKDLNDSQDPKQYVVLSRKRICRCLRAFSDNKYPLFTHLGGGGGGVSERGQCHFFLFFYCGAFPSLIISTTAPRTKTAHYAHTQIHKYTYAQFPAVAYDTLYELHLSSIMDACIMDTCITDTCIIDTCIMDTNYGYMQHG